MSGFTRVLCTVWLIAAQLNVVDLSKSNFLNPATALTNLASHLTFQQQCVESSYLPFEFGSKISSENPGLHHPDFYTLAFVLAQMCRYMFENRSLSTWSVIMLDNLHILVLKLLAPSAPVIILIKTMNMTQTIYCLQLKFSTLQLVSHIHIFSLTTRMYWCLL